MSLLPVEFLIKPVPDHDDLVAFQFDFTVEGKALEDGSSAQTVTEDENGDLIIEGYAAVFEGLDREGENFIPGAFERGIKGFLTNQSALCINHKREKVLGKVLGLNQDDKGLWMRARVDGAIKEHPEYKTYYQQIKNGTLNGLSVGGFFKRVVEGGRRMIGDVDFTEISVTGVPVHSGTNFAVVAGKALMDVEIPQLPEELSGAEVRDEDVRSLGWQIEELSATFDRLIASLSKRTTSGSE